MSQSAATNPASTDERRLSFYLTTDHLLRCRDGEGRPLGEQKLPEEERPGVPIRTARCPYPGSRFQHELPMNMSAFEQVSRLWHQTLGAMEVIRRACLARGAGTPPGEPAGLESLWAVSAACAVAPNYLLYRAREPFHSGELPAAVAVLYKISLGLFGAVESLAIQRMMMGGYDPSGTATPEELHELTENLGLFISHAGVCAGPPAMVDTSLRAITHGQPGEPQADALRAVIPDVTPLLGFAAEWRALRSVTFALLIRMHQLGHELSVPWELPGALAELRDGFGQLAGMVAGMDAEVRDQVASALGTSVAAELRPEFASALAWGTAPSADELGKRLQAGPGAQTLSAEVRSNLPGLAGQARHLEEGVLALLGKLQARQARALGYAGARPWDRADLRQCFGQTPLDQLAAACGLAPGALDASP